MFVRRNFLFDLAVMLILVKKQYAGAIITVKLSFLIVFYKESLQKIIFEQK